MHQYSIKSKNRKKGQSKPIKILLNICVQIFLLISFLSFTFMAALKIMKLSMCWDVDKFEMNILQSLCNGFYCFQMYFLWAISVLKLRIVFRNTIYRLSSFSIIILKALFIIEPIFIIILNYVPLIMIIENIVILIGFLFSISFSLFVSGLFIYKLICLYKMNKIESNLSSSGRTSIDKQILPIITKTSILFLISISFTTLSLISLIIHQQINNIYTFIFKDFLILMDMFTNVICVMMTFRLFNNPYKLLCGIIDNKCQGLYVSMVVVEQKRKRKNTVSTVVSSSATTSIDDDPRIETDIVVIR